MTTAWIDSLQDLSDWPRGAFGLYANGDLRSSQYTYADEAPGTANGAARGVGAHGVAQVMLPLPSLFKSSCPSL